MACAERSGYAARTMEKPLTLELELPLHTDLPGQEPAYSAESDSSFVVKRNDGSRIAGEPSLWTELPAGE